MGTVVSISTARDRDIESAFDGFCPPVPAAVERQVCRCAKRAVIADQPSGRHDRFRSVCLVVASICVLGLATVFILEPPGAAVGESDFAGKRFGVAGSDVSTAREESTAAVAYQWRQSREKWLLYIHELKQDPGYRKAIREQALFDARFGFAEKL